jgi:eukaryotic-like serine/threonine-protein kinase
MNSTERWEKIKDIFEAALSRTGSERRAFLEGACGSDAAMLREVESLLSSFDADYLEGAAVDEVAEAFVSSNTVELKRGALIGQYKIVGELGKGGQGAVYKAIDTRLDRTVAIKTLPAELTIDDTARKRFQREAKLASSLDHPNICGVHDLAEVDGTHFIVMQYVDGKNVRELVNGKPLELVSALKIGIQVCDALAAAHERGIIHRDIKAHNVIVAANGTAKVLDFGLAKLTGDGTVEHTELTELGSPYGTPTYAAPEQSRGEKVDHRADIFSTGVLIYELLTGTWAFHGKTSIDVRHAVLHDQPKPISERRKQPVPERLNNIVARALEKEPSGRYQNASAMRDELIEVLRALPEGQTSETNRFLDSLKPFSPARVAAFGRGRSIAAAAAVLVLALVAGYIVFQLAGKRSAAAFEKTEITQLTTSRNLRQVAISPDGKYIAYATTDGENESLWVRQANTANDLQIVSPGPADHEGIAFTRDSASIYYVTRDRNGVGILYRIPVLGGTPQKLISGVDTPVTFSPDGAQFAFVRGKYPTVDQSALLIANSDGSQERILAMHSAPYYFYPTSNWTGPSWSPDGELIACAVADVSGKRTGNVYTFAVKDGAARKIIPNDFSEVGRVEWLPDMSGLVIMGTEKIVGQFPGQLFHVSYPDGVTQRITNDFGNYRALSMTSDASKLVTISFSELYGIWVAPEGDAARARQILPVNRRASISWTPDNRIVYATMMSGRSDIWTMNADGGARKQLTSNAEQNIDPAVSPDGRYVAFYSTRTGQGEVWRVDIDGSNPRQLTEGLLTWQEAWTPDSRWVLFRTYPDQKIWKVPVDGGTPVAVTTRPAFRPSVSPDGKWLACFYSNSDAAVSTETVYDLAVLSLDGATPPKTFPFRGSRLGAVFTVLQWSPDGSAILYNSRIGNAVNIWSQPVDGSEPKQVTNFKDSDISAFAFSRDGRWLATARGTVTSDAVTITELK